MTRILLVEDDETLGATLAQCLEREGYMVRWVRTRSEAEDACGLPALRGKKGSDAPQPPFDLLVLDIGLPDGSGLDFARDLHFVAKVPMLFLSAMSSAEYRLEGFEIGAEDYIPKPFHLKELLLRIRRVLDRQHAKPLLEFPGFSLDRDASAVLFADGSREFPAQRDFQLLCLLAEQAPRALSRDEILARLWAGDTQQTGRTVDNAIVRLRHLLKRAGGDPIRSVRGVGYQFVTGGVPQPEE